MFPTNVCQNNRNMTYPATLHITKKGSEPNCDQVCVNFMALDQTND